MKNLLRFFLTAAALLCSAHGQSIPDGIGAAAVSTTDLNGKPWVYLRWSATDANLLKNQRWIVYGRPGGLNAGGAFTKQGMAIASPDPAVISVHLTHAAILGDDLHHLGEVMTELLSPARWNGPQGVPLAQQISAAMNRGGGEENSAQLLRTMGLGFPSMALIQGEAWAQRLPVAVGQPYTLEVRQALAGSPDVGGTVLTRVEIIAGQNTPIPAPGLPQQICDVSPRGHLAIKLWWPISPNLRRVSLSTYGYNLFRTARGHFTTPVTATQLRNGLSNGQVKKVNDTPILPKEADSIPVGPTDETAPYYYADDNGVAEKPATAVPLVEGQMFDYYVVGRDLLGKEGAVSPAGMGVAISTLPPATVENVEVEEITTSVGANNVPVRQLQIRWSQNADAAPIRTDAYRLFHGVAAGNTPASVEVLDRWSTETAAFAACQIQEVPHTVGFDPKKKRLFVDVTLPRVASLIDKTLWFSVQSIHNGPAGCQIPGAPSPPAFGLFRSTEGPDAPSGSISFSCPRIALWSIPLTSPPFNAGFTNPNPSTQAVQARWLRLDPGVDWVESKLVTASLASVTTTRADFGRMVYGDGVEDIVQNISLSFAEVQSGLVLMSRSGSRAGAISPWFSQAVDQLHPGDPAVLVMRHQTQSLTSGQVNPRQWQGYSLLYGFTPESEVTLFPISNGSVSADKAVRGNLTTGSSIPPATATQWEGVLVHLEPFRVVGAVTLNRIGQGGSGSVALANWTFSTLDTLAVFLNTGNYRVALFKEPAQICGHAARPESSDAIYPVDITLGWAANQNVSEYRLFRSFNDDTPSLIKQDARDFTAANITSIVTQDTAMPKAAGTLRYYAQTADQHGNASPLRLIATLPLIIKPAKPVLDKPETRRDAANNPEVLLRWVCPPDGVQRFRVHVVPESAAATTPKPANTPAPANVLPAQASNLFTAVAKGNVSLFADSEMVNVGYVFTKLFESFYTPAVGQQGFSAGPSYTTTVRIQGQGKYKVWIEAIDANGSPAAKSDERRFEWKEPTVAAPGYQIPWPARPLTKAAPAPASGVSRFNSSSAVLWSGINSISSVSNPSNAHILVWPLANVLGGEPCSGVLIGSWKKDYQAAHGFPYFDSVTDLASRLIIPVGPDKAFLMLYRQQVANPTFPTVSGATIQCTDSLFNILQNNQGTPPKTTLRDPRIGLTESTAVGGQIEAQLYLLDQQPQISKASYRYTLVQFRPDGEIANIYPTGIVTMP